ncbi:MAG: hypothetical protein E7497_02320 [Ruminococcus sp.]|nr:hypothetical protein [Ruminococcus sp.]
MKKIRLKNFDYSRNGLYFITICTKDRIRYLSEITWKKYNFNENNVCGFNVGDAALGVPNRDIIIKPISKLTRIGEIINRNINKIDEIYRYASVEKYVIMPEHLHIILFISDYYETNSGTPRAASPTKSISQIINALKAISTKQIGYSIWQRSYHDHIIRSEQEFIEIYKYIENNPVNWANNKFNQNKWR